MKNEAKNVQKDTVDEKVKSIKLVSEPLKSALEAVINAAPVGNVLAMYDTGAEFNAEQIASDAADFVLKGLVGALCYNVIDGHRGNGQTMLSNALDQVDQAAERDGTFRTEKSSDQRQQRIEWAARMDVQQAYRKSLQDFAIALYTAITGERYQSRAATSSSAKPDSQEQGIAARLKARRAQ
jgi:DNA-binding protein H-NS